VEIGFWSPPFGGQPDGGTEGLGTSDAGIVEPGPVDDIKVKPGCRCGSAEGAASLLVGFILFLALAGRGRFGNPKQPSLDN
jgi:hypothetical protein